ncbi:MAG: class I SAM-dependent methyltransferase [Candidatus Latescibacteria bacterium]|nr:class I SAM-dependent methyltransferase [Candidatus Latescibacterota bacterium]
MSQPDSLVVRENTGFYRALAAEYDLGREYFYRHERRRIAADLHWLAGCQPLAEAQILDVGCGTGFYAEIAAGLGAHHLHCLDLDEAFLAAARARILSANPRARVECHLADLASFAAERADLLSRIDIYLMGSVLQYVPAAAAQVAALAVPGRAGFYISSTRLPGGGRYPRLEKLLARLDYLAHRLVHPASRAAARPAAVAGAAKVTLEVDPAQLNQVLAAAGLQTRWYCYSAFHTALFNWLHGVLRRVWPTLGSHFTLLAARGAGVHSKGERWH